MQEGLGDELEESEVTGTRGCQGVGRGSLLTSCVTSGCSLSLLSLASWSSGRGSEGLSGTDGAGVHEAGFFTTDPRFPQGSSNQEGPEPRAITPDTTL